MEFPTIDKFAKDVAEKVLDEFIYEKKTIREWVELLAKQQSCEDAISRQEAISAIIDEYYPNAIAIDIVDTIANLPSVQPTIPTGKWEYVQYDYNPNIGNWHCSRCRGSHYSTDKLRWKYCPSCGARMEESEGKDGNTM